MTHRVNVGNSLDLVVVLALGQLSKTFRMQSATCWVELFPIVHSQLCPKGVDGNNESTPVCLKLQWQEKGD